MATDSLFFKKPWEGMVVEHIMTLSEFTVTSAPNMYFTSYGSLFKTFHHTKNNESFIKILFKHPIRTFEYGNRIIVLQKAMTIQQIH